MLLGICQILAIVVLKLIALHSVLFTYLYHSVIDHFTVAFPSLYFSNIAREICGKWGSKFADSGTEKKGTKDGGREQFKEEDGGREG